MEKLLLLGYGVLLTTTTTGRCTQKHERQTVHGIALYLSTVPYIPESINVSVSLLRQTTDTTSVIVAQKSRVIKSGDINTATTTAPAGQPIIPPPIRHTT